MNIDKFVTDLSKNPSKAIAYAVLLVLGIILIYWLFNKGKKIVQNISDSIENVRENPVESNNLTYENSWYKKNADAIFNAMDGAGTDETTVYNIFIKLRNQDDYNKLNREYGTRELSRFLQSSLTGTMIEHLRNDFSSQWLNNMQIFLRNNYAIEMK